MGKVVGYVRVSSIGQSLEVQREQLAGAGCSKIWVDEKAARVADGRPELQDCLATLKQADVLVITRMDRVARSALELTAIMDILAHKGASLRVLNHGIDTSTPEGNVIRRVIAAFAELEADVRAGKLADGIAVARRNGTRFGRKTALTDEQKARIRQLRNEEGYEVDQLCDRFGVSRATIYRALVP